MSSYRPPPNEFPPPPPVFVMEPIEQRAERATRNRIGGIDKMSEYYLRNWSRLVRGRDGGLCQMCGEVVSIWRMHAHHIYPKTLYPNLAYRLDNGMTLCVRCHLIIVHGSDTFNLGPWRFHVTGFRRWVGLAKQAKFNRENQHRLPLITEIKEQSNTPE